MRRLDQFCIGLLAVVLMLSFAQPSWAASCAETQQLTGGCAQANGDITNGTVAIGGKAVRDGSRIENRRGTPGDTLGEVEANQGPGRALPCPTDLMRPNGNYEGCFVSADEDEAAPPSDPGLPAVTLADLVGFRPTPAVQRMEPDGWMVVGLETNFYSQVGQEVQTGTLLGLPATVRFTPVAWHWDYGDGTARTTAAQGSTWRAAGVQEFDTTPTSHAFERPGSYTIRLTVDFAAEYRFAGAPWRSIAGTLPVAAGELTAVAGTADTVLVGRDCAANPRGPGC